MLIEENKNLQSLNTLSVPSTAAYFTAATSVSVIVDAVSWAQQNSLTVCVLGGGSNVILEPNIEALVVVPQLDGVELVRETADHYLVKAAAGENWHNFVTHCVAAGYYGIENLALIPGNVGAAPIQNIGAYGVEIENVFFELEALDLATKEIKTFSREACEFAYRQSVFKGSLKNRYIILSVTLCLSKEYKPVLSYPVLKYAMKDHAVCASSVMTAVVGIRQARLPDPKQVPNVGSFFKNPVVTAEIAEALKQEFKEIAVFDTDSNHKKLAAAWLIEHAGWKGKEKHGVKVHDDHALILTNPQRRDADSVLNLARDIQSDVRELFGIDLEVEPQSLFSGSDSIEPA